MSTREPISPTPVAAEPHRASAALTAGLVDDAAIFPPGNAPLDLAVTEHRAHRGAWYAPAIGPLLVRLSDAETLNALLRDDEGLAVGLVCPAQASADDVERGLDDVQHGHRGVVTAIEQPLSGSGTLASLVGVARRHEARVWAELPPESTLDGSLATWLDDVRAAGAGAKYRTGGVQPEATPSEAQLAAFIAGCVARRLRFKLTAGLHHAVRHTAVASGAQGQDLEQHGLLNVVGAVAAALVESDESAVALLLADRDPGRVTARVAGLDADTVRRVRSAFVSFGCCGVTDPLNDLVTLGLVGPSPLERGVLEHDVLARPADKETS